MPRPEHMGPPELYYNAEQAERYTSCSRTIKAQQVISDRVLEILQPEHDGVVLNAGIGSGLCSGPLEQQCHFWIGLDVSISMLRIARERQKCGHMGLGDLILADMGARLPFRPGTLSGAISISALQWLCYSNASSQVPQRRLHAFFESLYFSLERGSRAVLHFYPESEPQTNLILSAATKVGFAGEVIRDNPGTKSKRDFLVLSMNEGRKASTKRRQKMQSRKRGKIMKIKERQRRRGKDGIPHDSKYTARRRRPKF